MRQDEVVALSYILSVKQTVAADYAHDEEGLLLRKVIRGLHIQLPYLIIRAGNELLAGLRLRRKTFGGKDALLYGLGRHADYVDALVHMELSGLSVGKSVVIIHAISYVRVLLRLEKLDAALDGVHRTRLNLDKVACMHRHLANKLTPAPVAYHVV